jgi:hypothetical protein
MQEDSPLARVGTIVLIVVCALVIGAVAFFAISGLNNATQAVATAIAANPTANGRPAATRAPAASPAGATAGAAGSPAATAARPAGPTTASPTPPGGLALDVQIANPRPRPTDNQRVLGRLTNGAQPVAGAPCRLDVRFRSGTTTLEKATGEDGTVEIAFEFAGAAVGFPVQTELECNAAGRTVRGTAEFVPGS